MSNCRSCAATLPESHVCEYCGDAQRARCSNCGAAHARFSSQCNYCSTQQRSVERYPIIECRTIAAGAITAARIASGSITAARLR